jgi:SH3-like domain-containing protein
VGNLLRELRRAFKLTESSRIAVIPARWHRKKGVNLTLLRDSHNCTVKAKFLGKMIY